MNTLIDEVRKVYTVLLSNRRRERYAHDGLAAEPLGQVAGLQLFGVDGDWVKAHYDPDFVEGGNYKRYPYIPQGQVWIDKNVARHDWPAIALHELTETKRMERGMEYEPAHRLADKDEHEYRAANGIGGCRCGECQPEQYARRPEPARYSSAFDESKHPRGMPGNAGEFAPKGEASGDDTNPGGATYLSDFILNRRPISEADYGKVDQAIADLRKTHTEAQLQALAAGLGISRAGKMKKAALLEELGTLIRERMQDFQRNHPSEGERRQFAEEWRRKHARPGRTAYSLSESLAREFYRRGWPAVVDRESYGKIKPASGQLNLFGNEEKDQGPKDPAFEQQHPREEDGTFAEKTAGTPKEATGMDTPAMRTLASMADTYYPAQAQQLRTMTKEQLARIEAYLTAEGASAKNRSRNVLKNLSEGKAPIPLTPEEQASAEAAKREKQAREYANQMAAEARKREEETRQQAAAPQSRETERSRRIGAGLGIPIPYEYTEVREAAKAAGALWYPDRKMWLMPDAAAKEKIAQQIASKQAKAVPKSVKPQPAKAPSSAEVLEKAKRTPRGDGQAKSFDRSLGHGKKAQVEKTLPRVGEVFDRKDGPWIITSVGRLNLVTEDDIEDRDAWAEYPNGSGWYVSYTAVPVEPNDKEKADLERKATASRNAERRTTIASQVRTSENHKYETSVKGMTPIAGYRSMAGSEILYSDGKRLVLTTSSYDDGPNYWELADESLASEALQLATSIGSGPRQSTLRYGRSNSLSEALAREFYARGWIERYKAAPEPKGGWVTLGGGTRAHVSSHGTLDAACAGLKGEDIDDIGEGESEEHRRLREHRQDVAEHHGLEGHQMTQAQVKQLETMPHPDTGHIPRKPAPAPAGTPQPARTPASPVRVTLGNRQYHAKQEHGFWFTQLAGHPEAGWTMAGKGSIEEIQRQSQAAHATRQAELQKAVAKNRQKTASQEARKAARTDRMQKVIQTAEDHGLAPDELLAALEWVKQDAREKWNQPEPARQHARQLTGLTQRDTARLANQGFDYTSANRIGGPTGQRLAHWDEYAQEIAREHPELGWGDPENPRVDLGAALWDLIDEGAQQTPMAETPDMLRDAANLALAARNESGGSWQHEEGAAVGAGDEGLPDWLKEDFARRRDMVVRYRRFLDDRRTLRELFRKEWSQRVLVKEYPS